MSSEEDKESFESDLNIVAVRIEHKRAVVVRTVLRPQSRFAVVFAAGDERGVIEGVKPARAWRRERRCACSLDAARLDIATDRRAAVHRSRR